MIRPKYTKTSSFLFPLLEINKSMFNCNVVNSFNKVLLKTRFINAYLEDSVLDTSGYNEGSYLMVLMNSYQDVNFDAFYSTMVAYPNYKDDYERGNQLVMIYEIPEQRIADYDTILKGGYSKVSIEGKKLIKKHSYFHPADALSSILSKGVDLKNAWEEKLSYHKLNYVANLNEQEVWSSIVRDEERITNELLKTILPYYKVSLSKI